MGCYSIAGCISQLPIQENDRVAGIFCKINSSLEHSNIIRYNSDYVLVPMCPIIYGKYNDYGGLCPDKSVTVSILEHFFDIDINHIINAFVQNTENLSDGVSVDILKSLITKRDMTTFHNSENSFYNKTEVIIKNNWCLLLEHEDIIKTIINHNYDLLLLQAKFSRAPFINWDKLYDIQLELFKEHHLDDYTHNINDNNIDFELAFNLSKNFQDILFTSKHYNPFNGVYSNKNVMDLFQNYPDMFHYAFAKELKQEYLDTLKFYNVLSVSHINMIINHDTGYQWSNINLWKDLITIYNEIITSKHHYDY